MNKETIIAIVAEWANSEPLVRIAYVYGSWVKGTATESSDVDVAIKLNLKYGAKRERLDWAFEKQPLINSLQALLPYPVQLEWYDPVQTPKVHKGIMEASVLVYDEHDAETD